MGDVGDQIDAIRDLYKLSFDKNEFAFVFLDYSGIVFRSAHGNVCFDPGLMLEKKAINEIKELDLVFFTHSHWDHFDLSVARSLVEATETHVIAEEMVFEELVGKIPEDRLTLGDPRKLNKTHQIEGYEVTCIRGTHSRPLTQFKVDLGGLRVFHPGDSGFMSNSKRVDVAFLPTGSPSPTCSPHVALAMAIDIRPKVVVATHGKEKQMIQFKELMERDLPKTNVIIPEIHKVIPSSI
ncbi:MAG: MBL fold metallo-hydrolase [Candidatus Thorarchaeota archaeon]